MKEWEEFLLSLEKELGSEALVKWIPKLIRFDAANIYLEPEDSFQASWFEEHVRPKLKTLLNKNHRPIKVHLTPPPSSLKNTPSPKIKGENPSLHFSPSPIDPAMDFESFVPSQENQIVYKLLQDPSSYNPLYIFGAKHSGKTHLLMAAALRMKTQGKNVFFVRAETFTDHVVQAIRLSQMQQFRKIYREIDVLIVDNLDIFSKKAATQEEFFHTFNTLHMAGKQIILSAKCSPSKLSEIEPRLISRFEWGLFLELKKSPLPAILEKKVYKRNFPLSQEMILWLASTFPLSAVIALEALIFRSKQEPSIPLAKDLLQDLIAKEEVHKLTFEKIIKAIATHYGITSQDILGPSQVRSFSLPRQVAMYFCKHKLNLPLKKIGELFQRDHSTVLSSIRLIQKEVEKKSLNLLDFSGIQ